MSNERHSRSEAKTRASVFAALGDETRLSVLAKLCSGVPQSIARLTAGTNLSRQAVTKHLAILEEANLVTPLRQGRQRLHFINPVPINEIAERWIGKFDRSRLAALSDLKRALETKSRKSPK